jgi:Flp pilus assembly protein TadD
VLASRAAAVLVRDGSAPPDTALLALALALKSDDPAGAANAVDRLNRGAFDFLAPAMRAWLAFDRGEDAVASLDAEPSNTLARRYTMRHRALLLIAQRRPDEAMVALAPLLATGGDADLRIDAAQLFARTGERAMGRRLLEAGGSSYDQLRKRLRKEPKPDAEFGVSRLFLDLAVEVAGEDMAELSIVLTRAALLLDPEDDRARLYLAEALSLDGADALALAVLAEVQRDSPFASGAAAGEVAAFARAERLPEALDRARRMAEGRGATAADARTYGDLLAGAGDQTGAAQAYATALARTEGDGGWELHYLRGRALDKAGNWEEAQAALRRAVVLGPEQAEALTYLGNAQVARGEDPVGAAALLERAARLDPEDPDIAASLAWAYFQRGDTARALPLLEQAVKGDPGGTRVNEHLGDVYWQLGRHYEARYAWRAAALYADADAAKRIEAKLAGGSAAKTAQ